MRLRNVFQNVLKCQVHILSSWQLSINWKRAGPGSISIKIVFCSIRSCATTDCDPRIRVYFTYFKTKQFYLVPAAVDSPLIKLPDAVPITGGVRVLCVMAILVALITTPSTPISSTSTMPPSSASFVVLSTTHDLTQVMLQCEISDQLWKEII